MLLVLLFLTAILMLSFVWMIIDYIKTADEKLRSIGKQQNQSATVVQTQNFTYYKHQQKQTDEPNHQPHQRAPQQQQHQQQEKQVRPQQQHQPVTVATTAAPLQRESIEAEKTNMAERAIAQRGRRERNYGNGVSAADELERSEIKRRSRSEGPNRRLRQSMDEREGGKKQTYDGGGRRREESSESDDSDRNRRLPMGCAAAVNSDSDSDPVKWTKNPLVVRRVKRSDKNRQLEKRMSGGENGFNAKNRDSFYGNEDASSGSHGGGNSSSRDGGSGSKVSSKYQKLEEMRKRRINLAVTSDEEATPASRISRLRQRAIQSGLGEQTRTPSNIQMSELFNRRNQWGEQPEPLTKSQPPQNFISPRVAAPQKPAFNSPSTGFQHPSAPARPQYGPRMSPTSPQPTALSSHPFITQLLPQESQPSLTQNSRQSFQPVSKVIPTFNDQNRSSNPMAPSNQNRQGIQTSSQQNRTPKQAPARPPPPNVSAARQSFYTIPEPNSAPVTRALYNSSPEVGIRRFTTQVRVPSADSVLDSTPKIIPTSKVGNQIVPFGQSPRQVSSRGNPGPGQGYSYSANTSRTSPSQFNEVVELRLQANRGDRLKSQTKIPMKESSKAAAMIANSEDSLDELIESNIQYLDSEIDKAKTKRYPVTNVARSSSLPDPRRLSGHGSAPSLHEQPSIQVQASTSIQFHVSLPTDSRHAGTNVGAPVIQIAPSNAVEFQPSYGYEQHIKPYPEVVARKYSYDGHSRLSRPNSEYYDRDDLSKSDSQLNAVTVVPSYLGNNLHPDQAYSRGCVSDMNLRSNVESALQVPQMDKGMFSDVEYDIEVSERVKKWEKFMKVADGTGGGEKKNINLTPIQENNEGESNMLPSEVRKSVLLSKQPDLVPSYQKEVTYTPPPRQRPFSSDTSINRSAESGPPRLFSVETNANRFFQVIQDPSAGPRLGVQSQSVSSIFHAPISLKADNNFTDAKEIRQQMKANRQPALPISIGPMQAVSQQSLAQAPHYDSPLQEETTPVMKRSANFTPVKDQAKRGSRYQEELEEITSVKTDSVVNLRRRFDTDSATMTEDDDQKSVSTASAKLSRPSRLSPSQKDSDSTDWSSVIPGYQNKMKESDVWSPNLESTQGVPVSIERVTARTLQTIPFSEDPFWKEIEEMTSFDPNSMAGHLSVSSGQVEPTRSQHQIELTPPHSSTLPNQPRNNIMPPKERMQRSKSLYTPNITPLTINVDKTPSKAVTALDDVLDDISRSSMERKQLSPKKRAMEAEISASTAPGVSNAPGYMKAKQAGPQPAFTFEGGEFKFMKQDPQPAKKFDSGNHVQMRAEQVPSQSKQPMQFYQRQQQQQQQQQNRQSQMLQGSVNNYQLDPNLLKQKLLNTGLVVETDNEESIPSQYRGLPTSPPPSAAYMPFNSSKPSYTTQFTHSTVDAPLQSSGSFPSSFASAESAPIAPLKTNPLMTRSGPSALDDIQKALAPFRSTSYQPGPESLYGTTKFESFKDSGFDTTRGPSTKSTGWTFQAKPFETHEMRRPSEGSLSNTSTGRLQQVNESMDDLKDLAQNVERRINVIKTKLQSADEQSLDSILSSLRKLTPETKPVDSEPTSFEDYYTTKKSKLSDALSELDRIYDSLDLNNEELTGVPESRKYKPYRPSKSSDYILAPQPKSEHLRPMQTRISSVFIPGLKTKTKGDLDKETESEFDIISKSFQAIVDEVNQTTDMISRAAEKNKAENTAPETQKQTFKITLKPGESAATNTTTTAKAMPLSNISSVPGTKAPPATAPKPQEAKVKGGRFRSKLPNSSNDDQSNVKKNRSKSVPDLESNTSDLLGSAIQSAASATAETVPTTASTSAATKVTTAVVTTSASTPPLNRNRTRVRPVKDNKIIQDDRAARRDSFEKVLGMPPSPQPSPKVVRKMIYNNAVDLDMKIQPPQMFQDAPEEGAVETAPSQQQFSVKQQTQQMEDKIVHKPDADLNPVSVTSPATQKKVPPPTAAKPSVRTEVSLPTVRPPSKIPVSITVPVPAKNDPGKGKKNLQLNTNKTVVTDSSRSSSVTGTPSTASTASINLSPPVTDGNQTKSLTIHPKLDLPDSESSSSGGQRGKRKIGTGVAMILDRFSSNEDKMKKIQSTRSAPDLSGSLNEGEENDAETIDKPKTPAAMSTKDDKAPSNQQCNIQKAPNDKNKSDKQGSKPAPLKNTAVSTGEKNVIGIETKLPESGTTSPSPLSPRKPPQHPWARQTSDPDKQVSEASFETSVGSPKVVSKITRSVGGGASGYTTASEGPSTPQGRESPRQGMCSPNGVSRRVRPANRKIQTDASGSRERPHSFHELMSCFEDDPNRQARLDRFRKSASTDAVNSDGLVPKAFRSEPDLTNNGAQGAGKGQELNEVVFKFEVKQKS